MAMDVINKFYSTVHTTVSQLSGVLPGNNVTREYEVLEQVCTAGVGLMWKVYNGYKKSTKQEVSVFVFEKKMLERWAKDDRETMLETLRRGVQQLTKIRHPHVLTVQHPLEESRDSLAFATEPVFASLANVVGDAVRSDKKLYDVEIRHGLLQLFDGLSFLHNDAKIVHRNICAETIVINKNRSWKLFGFDFCIANQPSVDGKSFWPCREYSTSIHVLAQPSLEYCAPEIALNTINSPESDLFSLGVLVFTIYSGKPLKMFGSDYSSFRRYAADLNQRKYPSMNSVPSELIESLRALLHPSPNMRPQLHELKQIVYFQDVGVKTLSYLDSLYQWDNLQKSKFYKGLPQIIPTLPHRVNLHSILPYLVKEFINSPMIPFVLPNVLLIAEMSSQKEYCEHILTHLKPIFKLNDPIQILLIFMQKMDLLLKLTPAEEVKLHVLPLLYRSLECDMPQIQELCLAVLPTFSNLIDYNAMKNAVIPRIKKLCLNSTNVSVKVNCLISIGKLLEDLDKWLVLDEILPFLHQIQSREPAIIMAIIGIYKIAMTNTKLGITKDVMAHKCIPFLMPLCVENGLTIAQFNTIVALIREMFGRVEKEQREKLEQLSTIQRENKPRDASEILATELEKGTGSLSQGAKANTSLTNSVNSDDDMFSGFSISPPTKQSSAPSQGIQQLKLKSNNDALKISHTSSPKPDILSSLMNSNISNLSNSSSPKSSVAPTSAMSPIVNPYTSPGSNVTSPNQSHSTDAWTNNWHSANPLVMNHQLASPQANNSSNNNSSSLDKLNPFGGGNKSASVQRQVVNYIYPSGYNSSGASGISNGNSMSSLNNMNNLTPLIPQQNAAQKQAQDNKNLNTLSQQDILSFLN
ncbi:PREDICTED: SCY1-like protein 2 [Rhagoletis zephyria]|uniref:SCY1-like protein 2 n=2 Tax=Rhagoletis zephyria TaxID=28612 RepID=UPI0008118654|nr:PREDICTED: SCY1-like protein 2 [Rhagoletis zephyria]XP_017482611.1 PREDICTED: SCY1-like protein 2 [Rhagoletis zephyria]XP_017482612.1 PREDICTED: SCY1-like protein 2 [Rhagoletis zephyria]